MNISVPIAFILPLASATAVMAADIQGDWARGDGRAKVRIARCGADICATNTWIKPGTKGEKAGDVLVLKVEKVSAARYSGSAFDPQRDMSYRVTLDVAGNRMTSKGCVLGGLLCKGVDWTRVD